MCPSEVISACIEQMGFKALHVLCRAAEGAEFTAASTGGQISSRLLSMRSANALLELPAVNARSPAKPLSSQAPEIVKHCDATFCMCTGVGVWRVTIWLYFNLNFTIMVAADDTCVCMSGARSVSHSRAASTLMFECCRRKARYQRTVLCQRSS